MSSGDKLSAKEREILERQRQLAARLKPPPAKPPPPQRPAVNSRRTTAPAAKISLNKASSRGTKKTPKSDVIDLTDSNQKLSSAKQRSAEIPKRPSKKRALVRPSATRAILAGARSKASASSSSVPPSTTSIKLPASTNGRVVDSKPSPKLKRKKLTVESGSASLAKLVQHVSNGNDSMTGAQEQAGITPVTPDDFWKHMREWDFVSQYANEMKQQKQAASASKEPRDDATSAMFAKKPLPNVFLNPRHYMAAWAPLCLAECRAQILQEAMTRRNNSINLMNPIPVTTKSTTGRARYRGKSQLSVATDAPWLEDETGGHILVVPKDQRAAAECTDRSFTSNDFCLLIRPDYPTILNDIANGVARPPQGQDVDSPNPFRSVALIGHTEVSHNDWTSGVVLKVSKRRWAVIGQKDMLLVRLGSNVTALREFTALCGVDTLPLKRFLLGLHLEKAEHRRKLSSRQSTEQLLQVLGGTQALGTGFIEYCRQKFNTSQLTAIAASANEYGEGGFTLIKGPPGTGKTTTLCAVLNSLHIRQYNKYYEEVRRISAQRTGSRQAALEMARRIRPRVLVVAPSNAAVDNIILKIMEGGFIDGKGQRYNPSMIRVGVGQSDAVRAVALETKVDAILAEHMDIGRLDSSVAGYRVELSRITQDITSLRRRLHAIQTACPYPLSKDWEIRVHEDSFDETGRVYFVNHKEMQTTYEVPPPPEPGENHFPSTSMPEYRAYLSRIVKLVENYFSIKSNLERCTIIKAALDSGSNHIEMRQNLEAHVLNSVHMVMTTLGTAGNRTMENIDKFEVVVVDEAAQSVEPASLSALQLGSRHAVLVGDPQQLPATIFNVSGRNSKYDRSLFQRLEEAGQPVYMLNEQYRMHPKISHFPRHIFYGGSLLDGPNVRQADYGNPLRGILCRSVPNFQPFTILDLDSKEERGGTSLSNTAEAKLAVFLYQQMRVLTRGLSSSSRVAVITPYAQQSKLLRRMFSDALGPKFSDAVEVNTVDAFQGREANIVIFSAVRAAGSHGIGFLSDVRRMNVALTRAKHFLFVIARCESIVVNPYWENLVQHARETKAVVSVPIVSNGRDPKFGDLTSWPLEQATQSPPTDPRVRSAAAKQP